MTRPILWAAVAVAAFSLAACDREVRITRKDPPPPAGGASYKTVTRLDCPQAQGDLKLASAAPDGRTCAYHANDGTEVDLRLSDETALTALETELRALVPPPPPRAEKPVAEVSANGDKDAHLRFGGLSIDAEDGQAKISLGGLHIDSEGDNTDISVNKRGGGDVKILANDDGAEIRDSRSNERGVRRTLILARQKPTPAGYHLVGYEARGPQAGPLVVAVIRAKGDKDTDYVFKDMKALVTRNAGK
jgi:hypothetical protein